MSQINVQVTWKDGKPHVPPVPVEASEGETTIVWVAGDGIQSFEIDGLDPTQFIDQAHNPGKTEWEVLDKNTTPPGERPMSYEYTVAAVHTGGDTGFGEPVIINKSG